MVSRERLQKFIIPVNSQRKQKNTGALWIVLWAGHGRIQGRLHELAAAIEVREITIATSAVTWSL